MEKTKKQNIRKPTDKGPVSFTAGKRNKERKTDGIEIIFGIHAISSADIKSHFGSTNDNVANIIKKTR